MIYSSEFISSFYRINYQYEKLHSNMEFSPTHSKIECKYFFSYMIASSSVCFSMNSFHMLTNYLRYSAFPISDLKSSIQARFVPLKILSRFRELRMFLAPTVRKVVSRILHSFSLWTQSMTWTWLMPKWTSRWSNSRRYWDALPPRFTDRVMFDKNHLW